LPHGEQDVARAAEALAHARLPAFTRSAATSDIHLEHKLKKSRAEVIEMTRRAVAQARNYADDVEFSAEDATRSDIDYLCEVLDTAVEAGASVLNMPDTVGYTTPTEMNTLVEQVNERVRARQRRGNQCSLP
jgi:2-isopropylmalate synthase